MVADLYGGVLDFLVELRGLNLVGQLARGELGLEQLGPAHAPEVLERDTGQAQAAQERQEFVRRDALPPVAVVVREERVVIACAGLLHAVDAVGQKLLEDAGFRASALDVVLLLDGILAGVGEADAIREHLDVA